MVTQLASKTVQEQSVSRTDPEGLRTPCLLSGDKLVAFIDGEASRSFVSQSWVKTKGIEVTPMKGIIKQFIDGSEQPRIGVAKSLMLENGTKALSVDFEVANLEGGEHLVIGRDLFPLLGFEIVGVPFTWPQIEISEEVPKIPNSYNVPQRSTVMA